MKRQKSISSIISLIYAALALLTTQPIQALTMSTPTAVGKASPRIELFFSSSDELRKRLTFLKSKGVSSFNIVNKSNKDEILESVKIIQEEFQRDGEENVSIVLITP
jgi:hypothetical protein